MSLELFALIFWIFAVITVILKNSESLKTRTGLIKVVKPIPAISAVVFVIYMKLPAPALFYLLLAIALLLCAMGDIGMEMNILPGLGLFLFAHIFYTVNFLMMSVDLGIAVLPLTIFAIVLAGMFVYIYFYNRYIQTTEQEVLAVLLKSVNVYALMISLTLTSSLLLWLASDVLLGVIPFLGAILFVISDSLIGIKEFHHHFKFEEIYVLSTYFMAIFLLSLGVIVYTF